MENLLGLLERKSICYRSIFAMSNSFLDEIAKGDTTNLETFQKRRDGLIKVLEQMDFEITHIIEESNKAPGGFKAKLNSAIETKIRFFEREKDGILAEILKLDDQILKYIERIKEDTLQKLHSIQSGRKTVSAYKSPLSQDEGSLDHEA